MNTRFLRVCLASGLALTAAIGITACASTPSETPDQQVSGEAGTAPEKSSNSEIEPGVEADLIEAKRVVDEGLAEKGDQPEFYLAPDVKTAEQKYGMWVLPFEKSDASEKITNVVKIEGGKYEIVAVSAETGVEYVIDQNGNISQK